MNKFIRFFVLISIISMTVSCQKDDLTWIESSVPEEVDVKMLDAWSSVVPIEVKSNGEWNAELTNDNWFYLSQESGNGNATIQLCILDNRTEQRKNGTIKIVTKDGTSSTIEIQQQSVADYGDNGVLNTKGDIRYAVGYGFNALKGEYPSANTIAMQILDMNSLNADKKVEFNASKAEFEEKTIIGSSFEELSNKLNTSASIKGSGFGFSGEVNANFTMDNYKSGSHEFAISYIHYQMGYIRINTMTADLLEHYINPVAQKAIDGNSSRPAYKMYKGKEGAKKMIQDLGTHLIIKARMGGELRYKMAVDISKVTGAYDLHAFAKAAYASANISADASVTNDLKISFIQNSKNYTLNFVAYGGNPSCLTTNTNITELTKTQWINSLKTSEDEFNLSFLGVEMKNAEDREYLIPIQDLVSIEDNQQYEARVNEIMEAIAELKTAGNVSYVNSTEVKVQIPDFSNASPTSTLIKEVKIGGEVKAFICNEYIPILNKDARVTVIYPVINGKPRLNLGYFIGNATHKPARVSWANNKVYIKEYNHNAFGTNSTVYIIGASVNSTQTTQKVFDGQLSDTYLTADSEGINHNYPLVKIFSDIWTREDYKSVYDGAGNRVSSEVPWSHSNHAAVHSSVNIIQSYNRCYYRASFVKNANIAPHGWIVPSSNHYSNIAETLTANQVSQIGQAFRAKTAHLGYEAPTSEFGDWYAILEVRKDIYLIERRGLGVQNEYLTQEGHHVRMNDQGFAIEPVDLNNFMTVRLIMDIK